MDDSPKNKVGKASPPTRPVLLISLVLLVVGVAGYFLMSRGPLIFYIFAHLGALGLFGLIGGGLGILAIKKGRDYWTAFMLGCLLPIVAGLVAVVSIGDPWYCGGVVCLGVAALAALSYAFISKRVLPGPESSR